FFFFQAEDGIRDLIVTGVQTCALPISCPRSASVGEPACWGHYWICARAFLASSFPAKLVGELSAAAKALRAPSVSPTFSNARPRSEERRVGKECRCRWVWERAKR